MQSWRMTTCERCGFTGAAAEWCDTCSREKNRYVDVFDEEYRSARAELERLRALFTDVCWYSFETHVRNWRTPWHESDPDSRLVLYGVVQKRRWASWCYHTFTTFPVYYAGPVGEAPVLPPVIVYRELKDAEKYVDLCFERRRASFDWAPGGKEYKRLVEETRVGKDFPVRVQ